MNNNKNSTVYHLGSHVQLGHVDNFSVSQNLEEFNSVVVLLLHGFFANAFWFGGDETKGRKELYKKLAGDVKKCVLERAAV